MLRLPWQRGINQSGDFATYFKFYGFQKSGFIVPFVLVVSPFLPVSCTLVNVFLSYHRLKFQVCVYCTSEISAFKDSGSLRALFICFCIYYVLLFVISSYRMNDHNFLKTSNEN